MRTLFGPNVSGRLLTRSQFTRATTRDVCYERGTDAPGGIFGPKNKSGGLLTKVTTPGWMGPPITRTRAMHDSAVPLYGRNVSGLSADNCATEE